MFALFDARVCGDSSLGQSVRHHADFFFSKILAKTVFKRKKKTRARAHKHAKEEVTMSSSKGATTRAQKRRMGQRDLWDVIVNNDDICFKHILPRLNRTDVKFLFEVNSETRALIKRSSRKDDLNCGFKVEEMSSTSTLEIAWENRSLWSSDWDDGWADEEDFFCQRVAKTNKLELLKWIREEKKCDWDAWTINEAIYQDNLEMIKYCVANECPTDEHACESAAEKGNLEILKYLHEEAEAEWYDTTASNAAANGHLHILEYLVERKFDKFDTGVCQSAASNGQLDCLKYLREDVKAPWNEWAVYWANNKNQTECLQYLLDNDCPLPSGWSYENGILNKP